MSRTFASRNVNYATPAVPSNWKRSLSGPPFTVFAMVRPTAAGLTAGVMTVLSLEDADTAGEALVCQMHGSVSGQGFGFRAISSGVDKEAKKSMTLVSTDWYAVWWRAAAANDRVVAVNDTTPVSQTTSLTPTVNQCSVGRRFDGATQTNLLSAMVERLRVWDVAISDAEMAAWGKDASGAGDGPWQPIDTLQPQNMVWGWDMIRDQSSDATAVPDVIGGTSIVMSPTAPSSSATSPMIRRWRQ